MRLKLQNHTVTTASVRPGLPMGASEAKPRSERELLFLALAFPPEQQQPFLDDACKGDQNLRDRLQALLRSAQAQSAFMDGPAIALSDTSPLKSGVPGMKIGRYKLMEQVGEGGMGVVFVAEQTEPVRRTVALKLIKPGMDTKQVIARFEAERQALALMDHPNIARVLDAGTTDAGLPYFVMELVRGLPITDYCDQAKLSPEDRLKLFQTVCSAVQHAHLKGIIHRDLKPINVLVTLHDGVPVVKVIDFGVAKALHQQLTPHTVYTALNQVMGTPMYMSPEQLELSGLDIDTRTDVYSLGVLLYELLTGVPPFANSELYKSGLDELRRIIREIDPPRPSLRVTTFDEESKSTNATRRGLDQRSFSKTYKGELDWIVMKALEKDRNRRYESASTIAADVQRYLDNEPIEARRPTFAYLLQKAIMKNKRLASSILIVAVGLLVSTVVSVSFSIQAISDRDRAIKAEKTAQQDFDRAMTALDTIVEEMASVESDTVDLPSLLQRVVLERVVSHYEQFSKAHPNDPVARFRHAAALLRTSKAQAAFGNQQDWVKPSEDAARKLSQLLLERPDSRDARMLLYQCHLHRATCFENTNDQSTELLKAWNLGSQLLESANLEETSALLECLVRLAIIKADDLKYSRLNVDRAQSEYSKRAIDMPPNFFLAKCVVALRGGQSSEAIQHLNEAIRRAQIISRDATQAEHLLNGGITGNWYLQVANELFQRGHTADAERLWWSEIQINAKGAAKFGSIGRFRLELSKLVERFSEHLLAQGRVEQYRQPALELLAEFEHLPEIHELNSHILCNSLDATAQLQNAINRFPSQPEYHLSLAHVLSCRAMIEPAREQMRHALTLGETDWVRNQRWSTGFLAQAYDFAGSPQKSVDLWSQQIDRGVNLRSAYRNRAHHHMKASNYGLALLDLKKSLTPGPQDSEVLVFVNPSTFAGCPDEAIKQEYRNFISEAEKQCTSTFTSKLFALYVRSAFSNEDPHFAEEIRKLANAEFSSAPIHKWRELAILFAKLNDHEGYRETCTKMVANQRNRPIDYFNVSHTSMACIAAPSALDDYDWLAQATHAYNSNVSNRSTVVNLSEGAVLVRAGQFKKGLDLLQKYNGDGAYDLFYNLAVCSHFKAIALSKLGRSNEAKLEIDRAKAFSGEFLSNPPPFVEEQITLINTLQRELGELELDLKSTSIGSDG